VTGGGQDFVRAYSQHVYGIRLVTFMHYDFGYLDLEQKLCSHMTTFSALKCHA
jgi:hypothetical protein